MTKNAQLLTKDTTS